MDQSPAGGQDSLLLQMSVQKAGEPSNPALIQFMIYAEILDEVDRQLRVWD